MSKSDLFFRAMKAKQGGAQHSPMSGENRSKPAPSFGGERRPAPARPAPRYAEGGEVGEETSEAEGMVSDEEKFAASEVQSALNGGSPEALALALKSFFLIVEAAPHEEGGAPMEAEEPSFLDR